MIRFMCPRCKAVLEQPDGAAGSKLPCSSCGQKLQVPMPPENKTVLGAPVRDEPPAVSQATGAIPIAQGSVATAAAGTQSSGAAPAPPSSQVQVRAVLGREHVFWPCPLCQNVVDVPQDLGQIAVRCPHCARKIEVPYPSGTVRRVVPPPTALPPTALPPSAPPPSTPPPSAPPRPRYEDDWDRRPPPSRRRYDDEDDDYPREGSRRFRRRGEDAARSSVSGLICSVISLGLLLISFFIWLITIETTRRSRAEGLVCVLTLIIIGSFVLSLIGTISSSRGLAPENYDSRGAAVAGLVCGIIALVISSLIGFILVIALIV